MYYQQLPQRAIDQTNRELWELHKRVLLQYLMQKGLDYGPRQKFFIIYDHFITPDNVRDYFYAPCWLFIKYLITDRLDKIKGCTTCFIPEPKKKVTSVKVKVKKKKKKKKYV